MVHTVSEAVSNSCKDPTAASNGPTLSLAATQTDLFTPASASSTASSSASSGQRTNTSSAGSGSSNKLPCEDATLEFSGYDNFALKVSPVLSGKTSTGQVTCAADLLQQYTP